MKLFLDLKNRRFVKSTASNVALDRIVLKRRDTLPLQVVYVENGAVATPPAGTTAAVGLKAKFSDSNFLAFAAPGQTTLDLYTEPVEAAFLSNPASISALLEIRWGAPGTAHRTATLQVELQNSVITGDEATPAAIPDGKASEAEATTGEDNTKWMTPLRTAQAIQALAAASIDTLQTTLATVQARQRLVTARLYNDNAAVVGGGRPGTEDPSSLVRPGWYFTNTTAGQKINWYFWSIAQPGIPSIPAAEFSPYTLLTPDTLGSSPFIVFYSAPTGTNDAFPGFYHSAWTYQLPTATLASLTPSQKVLLYAQHDPVCHPGLPHHALTYVPAASHGPRLPTETIAFAALHSDSGATPGSVQWLVESLGVDHPLLRLEIRLAIRPIATSLSDTLRGFEQVATLQDLPPTGRLTRLYLIQESNQTYRWTGTTYRLTPDEADAGSY